MHNASEAANMLQKQQICFKNNKYASKAANMLQEHMLNARCCSWDCRHSKHAPGLYWTQNITPYNSRCMHLEHNFGPKSQKAQRSGLCVSYTFQINRICILLANYFLAHLMVLSRVVDFKELRTCRTAIQFEYLNDRKSKMNVICQKFQTVSP